MSTVVVLAGCGSGTTPAHTTGTTGTGPALATKPAGKGEVVVRGDASPRTAGPFTFSGTYRVRFLQYAPEDPRHDFKGETSFVVDLDQQAGTPSKHVFRAAAATGARRMRIDGRYYVDVSFGDFPFAVRFTPVHR